jgi:hypothetical protein
MTLHIAIAATPRSRSADVRRFFRMTFLRGDSCRDLAPVRRDPLSIQIRQRRR